MAVARTRETRLGHDTLTELGLHRLNCPEDSEASPRKPIHSLESFLRAR